MRAQHSPREGGTPIDVPKDVTLVGRKEDCDLRLDHKSVSKLHCVIVKTDGLLLLRDLGSTNGTRVNGTRIRRAALLPNDQLTIANYSFKIRLGGEEPPASPEDHTEQLNAADVAHLLPPAVVPVAVGPPPLVSGSLAMPLLHLQNALPDVSPDEDQQP